MTIPVLEPIVSGNPSGQTILFVQGWPDDASLWDDAVASLEPKYRCVRVNMPNYPGAVSARWGFRTEEIVEALVDLIRRVASNGPITLVLHDWGCYWGHAAHNRCPELVARVASIDIAPHFNPGLAAAVGMVSYQSYLLAAFAIGGRVGDVMTRRLAKLLGAPGDASRIHAGMNYPYRNVFEDLASGRARALTKDYWPTCPLLFVYGSRKPLHFHTDRWFEHLRKVGGEIVALNSNHWVPKHRDFPATLKGWLERTDARAHVLSAS